MSKLTTAYLQTQESGWEHPLEVWFPDPPDGTIIIPLPDNSVGKIHVRVVIGEDLVEAQAP